MKLETVVIKLNEVRLYGYHGMTAEEQVVGNHFRMNAQLTIEVPNEGFCMDNLEGSINYAEAYECMKEEFGKTSRTLETVVERMLERLFKDFPILLEAEVELTKENPPFGADCEGAAVRIRASR